MTIAFVQAAQTSATIMQATNSGATCLATLAAPPTAGNLLIAIVSGQSSNSYTMAGWTKLLESLVQYTNTQGSGYCTKGIWKRIAQAGDATTVATVVNTDGSSRNLLVQVAEYSGITNPAFDQGTYVDDTATHQTAKAMNALTPTAGVPVLMLVHNSLNPNYNPAMPSGWTQRLHFSVSGGPRYTSDLGDQIVANPSGSYGGTFTGAGAETAWHIGTILATGGGAGHSFGTVL